MFGLLLTILAAGAASAAQDPPPAGVEPAPTPTVDPAQPIVSDGGDTVVYLPAYFTASRPSTALEMAHLVPGFAIQGGSMGRGLEGSATNVLIDGRQLPGKGEGVSSALARIPASSVVAVIRIRGTQPGIDMGGYAEVLNILRFPRSDSGGVASLSAGKTAGALTRGLNLSGTHGRPGQAFSASLNVSESEGGMRSVLARDGQAPLQVASEMRSDSRGGGGAVDLALGTKTSLRVEASDSRSTSSSSENQSDEAGSVLAVVSKSDGGSRKFSARIDRTVGSVFASLDTVHSESQNQGDSRSISASGQNRFISSGDNAETAAGVSLRWKPPGPWQLEGGVDYALNSLDNLTLLGINGDPVPLPGSNIEVSEERVGAALKLGWQPKGDWSGTARLRVNHAEIAGGGALDDRRTLIEIKPELDVQGLLGEKTKLDLRVARKIDQLAFGAFTASAKLDDGTVTLGNPQIDPVRRWVVESTLRRPLLGKAELSVSARAEHIDNPTEVVRTASGFDVLDNIGAAGSVRLSGQLGLPLDEVGIRGGRLDVGGGVGASRVTDPTTGESRALSGGAGASWSARFQHILANLPVSYGLSASGSRSQPSYRPAEFGKSDSAPGINAFVEVDLAKKLSARAQIGRSGASRYERTLFAGDRSSGTVIEHEVQDYPAAVSGQLTLRMEL